MNHWLPWSTRVAASLLWVAASGGAVTLPLGAGGTRAALAAAPTQAPGRLTLASVPASVTGSSPTSTSLIESVERDAVASPASVVPGRLYTVMGTPHTWLADPQGVLHWVGDSIALARALFPERSYTLDDPLDAALRQSLAGPLPLTYEQLIATPRGAPLLSTAFVALDDEIDYPRWDAFREKPVLLRVASPGDLNVFGITPANRATYVLPAGVWEQRYGHPLDSLDRDELRPAGPEQPQPLPCQPSIQEITLQPGGAVAQLTNSCDTRLRARLSAVLYHTAEDQPLATTFSATVTLNPGETQTVSVSVTQPRPSRSGTAGADEGGSNGPGSGDAGAQPPIGRAAQADWVQPLLDSGPVPLSRPLPPNLPPNLPPELIAALQRAAEAGAPPPPPLCIDVGATGCLHTDPWLLRAVQVLQGLDVGRPLLVTAADFGVTLRRGELHAALGEYDPETRTVTIASSLDNESDWERADVLSHELQHASDHSSGVLLSEHGSAACLAHEQAAFSREAQVWQALWKGSLPEPRDRIQDTMNKAVADMADPAAQAHALAPLYVGECAR